MKVQLKCYSQSKILISKLFKELKKIGSVVRLPNKEIKVVLRQAPNGKGYATFKKYTLKMHTMLAEIDNLKETSKLNKYHQEGVYLEVKIL